MIIHSWKKEGARIDTFPFFPPMDIKGMLILYDKGFQQTIKT
ncbi:hypothetical protein HMPREF0083_03500 [Aneurinibacillus aneurinilyticus ATCC 12856]|uniref:Uncharacterized protein n=1 Tax=Aneurinibacillus aneurinilyticus ATCC 12856 TaxID=649747 RepID=U1X093_ANEAE|nr:hypothetical protein HMPREF0083_03500 [Aneurinibacillus aneurinilyticus ATCC 12856]